ncbi:MULTISPECIES: NTP transferase domain-containing protein [unclassified Kitasatospora]|uniref:nucleotidyltransferase family protein n=1 Tax=unclassified Kitasatospora TaxID=2633591 RepID=UPI00070ED8D1|nr:MULTISPECIES: NTP transferase domain-containing protein [unclassified Kitasatospora]KQV21678.1 4-diphosphocytidyl-2C-methyl-D-erythritol synthase [Kitasatospora sp. Root107]KRB75531.1 4-diphosphocytidyl-2C-methyl-D-erythritol synthase [Kitasatospora sp. Root187]
MAALPYVPALVLAAGGGRRLGGRPKALIDYLDRPLLEHALAVVRAGGCDTTVAVLGAAAEQVRATADTGDCLLVDNPDWTSGMGSSLRAGLAALPAGADAVLVMLVDTPGVTPAAVARLLAAHRAGAELAAAAYDGRRGHPVLIAARHFAEAAAGAEGDAGARALLAVHAPDVRLVECGDVAVPDDLDTPADLARWTDRQNGRSCAPDVPLVSP